MAPTEKQLLTARIARMKALVKRLEDACAATDEARKDFDALKRELEAARKELTIIDVPGSS